MKRQMLVELEWDDKLGEKWMNIDNLRLCLYSNQHSAPELLTAKEKFLPSLLIEIDKAEWSKVETLNPDSEEYREQYKKAEMTSNIIVTISKRIRGEG